MTRRELFSQEEDEKLKELYTRFGKNWSRIAVQMPGRTPRACRDRWQFYLGGSILRAEEKLSEWLGINTASDRPDEVVTIAPVPAALLGRRGGVLRLV
jgi:hypothetical protein